MIKLKPLIDEGIDDPNILKAFILAGGPGSGKSAVVNTIFGIPEDLTFSPYGLKISNSDKAFEYLMKKKNLPTKREKYSSEEEYNKVFSGTPGTVRGRAKDIKNAQLDLYLDGRLGLIMDGTGDDYYKVEKTKKMLESLGYDVYMIFVNTSLDIALQRNRKRDRSLADDVVKDIWVVVQKNLGGFNKMFGGNFIIVDNSEIEKDPKTNKLMLQQYISKEIGKFLNKPLKNPIGKQWIEQQKQNKKRK